MKILVFNWKDITHPFAGGAEHHIHQQAKIWVKQGHQVTLYAPCYNSSKREETIDGVHIHRAGGRFGSYFLAPFYYFLHFRKKYDVIIDVENGIPFFTPLFSMKPKVLIMHHVHKNVFFRELPFPIFFLPYIAEQYVMPLVYRNIPIIAVSASTKEETQKLGLLERNIHIIHNGIQPEEFITKKQKEKTPTIIYLGRMMKYKQLDTLLTIFANVQRVIPKATLRLVGTGPELPALREHVRKHKIPHVHFYEFVTPQEKNDLLQSSWIFVTPSSLEGWGITVIEANACGLPAIAFDVPGLRESIKHNKTGYLVRDQTTMQAAIITFLQNKKLREQLGKNAKQWSTHFSWQKTAEKTMRLIKDITHDNT